LEGIDIIQPIYPSIESCQRTTANQQLVTDLRPQITPHLNFQLQLAPTGAPCEATFLNLSVEKANRLLAWEPIWNFEETISRTVSWYDQVYHKGVTPQEINCRQIAEYSKFLSSHSSL
jgi:hypothetical protein